MCILRVSSSASSLAFRPSASRRRDRRLSASQKALVAGLVVRVHHHRSHRRLRSSPGAWCTAARPSSQRTHTSTRRSQQAYAHTPSHLRWAKRQSMGRLDEALEFTRGSQSHEPTSPSPILSLLDSTPPIQILSEALCSRAKRIF